ncbi:hypothetical protein [Ruegeria arenilitoris]|uniref:hypothetical protein n=1 Tax=Ruegeria arenilitoris TaxID=1173585 RepID=UPI00147CA589|nr:hypothetical protein [Ruegeria arenilitoris]
MSFWSFFLPYFVALLVLSLLSYICVSLFWLKPLERLHILLALVIDVVITISLMSVLTVIALLYATGFAVSETCGDPLTSGLPCPILEKFGWSVWAILIWIPVTFFGLVRRLKVAFVENRAAS